MSDPRLATPNETPAASGVGRAGNTGETPRAAKHRTVTYDRVRLAAERAGVDVVQAMRAVLGLRVPVDLSRLVADALRDVGVEVPAPTPDEQPTD